MKIGLLLVVLVVAGAAPTVGRAAEDPAAPIYQIEPKPDPRFPGGNVALVQGVTDRIGHRYKFPGTVILQPISVTAYVKEPGDQVRVRVVKDDWKAPDRDGTTGTERRVEFKFRTHDGFNLWVTADRETPYQLAVWIGDEIEVPPPPATMTLSVYKQRHPEDKAAVSDAPSSGFPMTWAIAALAAAVLVAGVLIFFGLKRRKAP